MSNHSESSSVSAGSRSSSQSPKKAHYHDWPNSQGFDVKYEEREPIELQVEGSIPSYASGVLFRTGLGPRDVHRKSDGKLASRTNHWFDAFSTTHRFQIHAPSAGSEKVKVTYNSRGASDGLIERLQNGGKTETFTFGAKYDPCKTMFSKISSFFEKDPENKEPNEIINGVTMSINYPGISPTGAPTKDRYQSGEIVSLCHKTDRPRLQMLDPNTLEPIGIAQQTMLHPDLTGIMSAAHAKSDPVTGHVYNFNLDVAGPRSTYRIFKTDPQTGETSILSAIKHAPAYLHSMFLSEHYLILCIWNSHFKAGGVAVMYHKNVVDALYHNDKAPATWYVIDKRDPITEGGQGCVAVYESDPFFAFHTVNAYEEPNKENPNQIDIVADIPTWSTMDVIREFLLDNMMSNSERLRDIEIDQVRPDLERPRLRRYRLPNVPKLNLSASASATKTTKKPINPASLPRIKANVDWTTPDAASMELPTINFNRVTKPHTHVYGLIFANGKKSSFMDGIIKYNVDTHDFIKWEKHGHTPGEAIFVPNPDADPSDPKDEDNGVLLSVVLDGYKDSSYLLVLDAKDLKEVGRANVPGPVGFGFHGIFTKMRVAGGGDVDLNENVAKEKMEHELFY